MFTELRLSSDEEWLAARKKVLTATEVSSVLGLNKYQSAQKMWEKKNEPSEFFENAYTIVGQWLEPVVVKATNRMLSKNHKLYGNGTKSFFVDHEIGLGATPDAGDGETLLECKTTKPTNYMRWADHPPVQYLTQLYIQMICCSIDTGYLSILSTDLSQESPDLHLDLSIFKLTVDKSITSDILKEIERFWATVNDGKKFRSDKKLAQTLELKLRFNTVRVF